METPGLINKIGENTIMDQQKVGNNGQTQSYVTIEEILDKKADDDTFKKLGISDKKEIILKDLQANILKGIKHKYTLFCFLTFKEENLKNNIVAWLKDMPLTSAFAQNDLKAKDNAVSLFLSFAGYEFFCDPNKILHYIPQEDDDIIAFKEGLAQRCPKAFGGERRRPVEDDYEQASHALIMIASNNKRLKEMNDSDVEKKERDKNLLDFFIEETKASTGHSYEKGFGKVFFEIGMRNPEGSDGDPKEWFGFRDGISNPRFFPRQNLAFDLGYQPDEPSKLNVALRRNHLSPKPYACGSFVVFLKMEQDVEAFNEKVDKLADKLNMEDYKGYVAAYMMGRHKDGTPLHQSFKYPSHGDGNLNNFNFEDDPNGEVCPFHSHVRKANPRDGNQKRIVRRGKVYGNSESENKGVLFLSYQNSLRNFEEIVNNGLYGYNYNTKNTGRDALFVEKGKYAKSHVYRNAAGKPVSAYINTNKELVKFRGGQYFFASSISFIRCNLENCM